MKKKYQNGFFIFGFVVLIIMITQLDFAQVWSGLKNAGYWFFAVLVLWIFIYMFNTASWYIIINGVCSQCEDKKPAKRAVPITWLYKLTVSGFALNYATPGGMMGGVPYRIMELAPRIGTERASSSVILFEMTHIFCHFLFWLASALVFVFIHPLNFFLTIVIGLTIAFTGLGIWFFIAGYRKGLANRVMNLMRHIPFVKRWATPFVEGHREQLDTIDTQIAALHRQNPKIFIGAILLEFSCRIFSALEIYFILLVLMPEVNFVSCVLILAFTSLFANLLFFIPLQLGGREGGFLMSTTTLGFSASAGIFIALIVRIRELVWTSIGLFLIKINKKAEQA